MTKLIPPVDFVSANIGGAEYTVAEDGFVHVNEHDHVVVLTSPFHGLVVDGSEAPVEVPASAATAPELISDALARKEQEALEAKKANAGKKAKPTADPAADPAATTEGTEPPAAEDGDNEDNDDDDKKPETVTVEQIEEMNKVDLIDFIEERGGEVANGAKKPELLEQALKLLADSKSE